MIVSFKTVQSVQYIFLVLFFYTLHMQRSTLLAQFVQLQYIRLNFFNKGLKFTTLKLEQNNLLGLYCIRNLYTGHVINHLHRNNVDLK